MKQGRTRDAPHHIHGLCDWWCLFHDQLSVICGIGSRLSLTTLAGNGKEQETTKRSKEQPHLPQKPKLRKRQVALTAGYLVLLPFHEQIHYSRAP